MRRVAHISAILEDPAACQQNFNDVVSIYNSLVKGRFGIPMPDEGIAVISLVIIGTVDEINSITGKLGNIENVTVKTSISKKELP